ncbi:MAG: hypothetical protein MUF51_11620, partial [Vicinamibacteria bacterium]|nr:hypothetical protein [Vicinamibacteria bacterium]
MTLLYLHHVALWTALLPAAPWFDPTPTQPSEIQLRDLSISCATNVTPSCLTSWRALMAARPDSAVAGLAGLSAGLLLLDQNRPSEALPFLTHPAIARTALDDHAALAAGRAQALIGDQAKAAALLLDLAERGPKGPLTCRALLEGGAAAARAQLADRAREAMERGL